MDLILDATFAAALNDFRLGEDRSPPARFDSTL
jgi:hypothetical protein